jgi:dephospho-CoA kinase
MDRMKTIGVVGGVASGKSRVAHMLADLGAGVLDADRAGHDVLETNAEVRETIRQHWGPAVLTADGHVNRQAVARRVFAAGEQAAEDRDFLERLLHPLIRERLEALREKFAAERRPAVVLDAPLLLEAGWGPMCDVIAMIEAPREVRVQRGRQRGWNEAEFDRREAAQWTVDEKRRHAHVVVPNAGSEHDLRRAVEQFWTAHVLPKV